MKKRKIKNIIFAFIFIVGLVIMLFPTISNLIKDYEHKHESLTYYEITDSMNDATYEKLLKSAKKYNKQVYKAGSLSMSEAIEKNFKGKKYNDQLSVNGSTVMGIIRIPVIDVELPIYHGTSTNTLQVGIGHYQGSSLPVGGKGTNCVLTGHTGLPGVRLFTDLDKLVIGDVFYLDVLTDTYAYQVDKLDIIYPDEMNTLTFDKNEDYCTLVTCTPYGVNTQRRVVRGHRIKYTDIDSELKNEVYLVSDYEWIAGSIILLFIVKGLKRRLKKDEKEV